MNDKALGDDLLDALELVLRNAEQGRWGDARAEGRFLLAAAEKRGHDIAANEHAVGPTVLKQGHAHQAPLFGTLVDRC